MLTTLVMVAIVMHSRQRDHIVTFYPVVARQSTPLSGTWAFGEFEHLCQEAELKCSSSDGPLKKNTSRFIFDSPVVFPELSRFTNIAFVGDSYARALFETASCYLSSLPGVILNVTDDGEKESAACTDGCWQHNLKYISVTHAVNKDINFNLSFTWAPFLSRATIVDRGRDTKLYERFVSIDRNQFLYESQRKKLMEHSGETQTLIVIYAEHHWNFSQYSYLDENAWEWVKPKYIPQLVNEYQRQARSAAYQFITSTQHDNLRAVELSTFDNLEPLPYTYLIPQMLLEPPVKIETKSHWCTELVSWTVLKVVLFQFM
jgi:hypothetical protein